MRPLCGGLAFVLQREQMNGILEKAALCAAEAEPSVLPLT